MQPWHWVGIGQGEGWVYALRAETGVYTVATVDINEGEGLFAMNSTGARPLAVLILLNKEGTTGNPHCTEDVSNMVMNCSTTGFCATMTFNTD